MPATHQLPTHCDLATLGLDPSTVTATTLLRQQHGHHLYRLTTGPASYILKWFDDPTTATEIRAYDLLTRLGVPTLPVHGQSANALLLADLDAGQQWRLATAADTRLAATGAAVAEWYQLLHPAGQTLLSTAPPPDWLPPRESDTLQPAHILAIGQRLQLAHLPVWRLAAEYLAPLQQAVRALPTTLTYNDFHWTNLALSRPPTPGQRAIIFDYHLLSLGIRYSDYRNVCSSLNGPALATFQATYGPVDERERILDEPLGTLYGLHEALRRPQLPRWALDLVDEATSGRLASKLQRALEVVKFT